MHALHGCRNCVLTQYCPRKLWQEQSEVVDFNAPIAGSECKKKTECFARPNMRRLNTKIKKTEIATCSKFIIFLKVPDSVASLPSVAPEIEDGLLPLQVAPSDSVYFQKAKVKLKNLYVE